MACSSYIEGGEIFFWAWRAIIGKFVRDFSLIASPLHKLSQKDVRFKWTQACQEAFTALKSKLTSAPVLAYPDFSLEFIVDADASGEGSGAVLSQVVEGKEHPNCICQ